MGQFLGYIEYLVSFFPPIWDHHPPLLYCASVCQQMYFFAFSRRPKITRMSSISWRPFWWSEWQRRTISPAASPLSHLNIRELYRKRSRRIENRRKIPMPVGCKFSCCLFLDTLILISFHNFRSRFPLNRFPPDTMEEEDAAEESNDAYVDADEDDDDDQIDASMEFWWSPWLPLPWPRRDKTMVCCWFSCDFTSSHLSVHVQTVKLMLLRLFVVMLISIYL